MPEAWLLPVAVVRQHVGDLHAVGWGEGPIALVIPVKAIRMGIILKTSIFYLNGINEKIDFTDPSYRFQGLRWTDTDKSKQIN